MEIQLPEKVNQIITTLQSQGYEAYAVGGCVRDCLLGRTPKDWDITTSALPQQVKALFSRTVDTGIAHGTVTVLWKGEGFEVTTYRIDGTYEDSRHPKEVRFTRSLWEDLRRRDFTINAMAYNREDGLIDRFGGREDLRRGIVRCVGEARERFQEDALRILRALRFSAQLGFELEEETSRAAEELAGNLEKISAERIQAEVVKLLTSPHPEALRDGYRLGITRVILPEFDRMMETTQETPHHCYTVGEHTIRALMAIEPDKILRLTMLFHDMAKPCKKFFDKQGRAHFKGHAEQGEKMAGDVMRRWKFDNDTMRNVRKLVACHDDRIPASFPQVRREMCKIGAEWFPYYLKVRWADVAAQSLYCREEKQENIRQIGKVYEEIIKKGQCVSLKGLAVSGTDLIREGVEPGPRIGQLLEQLLEEVLEEPGKNERACLLERVQELLEPEQRPK